MIVKVGFLFVKIGVFRFNQNQPIQSSFTIFYGLDPLFKTKNIISILSIHVILVFKKIYILLLFQF